VTIDKPFGNQFITNPKTLGEHIRRKRVKSNLIQKEVANTIGVSEDSITYWENNRAAPQIQFYPKIIDFLGYIPFEIDSKTFEGKIQLYLDILVKLTT
jgi:DNA-binding XRE family transcriptional regulator